MTNKRLIIVRKILSLLDKPVHYIRGATACPVCTYIGGGVGDVKVTSTSDDIRYCRCSLCGATFKAVCCDKKETVKTPKSFDKTEKRVIKKKRTKKNGKSHTT